MVQGGGLCQWVLSSLKIIVDRGNINFNNTDFKKHIGILPTVIGVTDCFPTSAVADDALKKAGVEYKGYVRGYPLDPDQKTFSDEGIKITSDDSGSIKLTVSKNIQSIPDAFTCRYMKSGQGKTILLDFFYNCHDCTNP